MLVHFCCSPFPLCLHTKTKLQVVAKTIFVFLWKTKLKVWRFLKLCLLSDLADMHKQSICNVHFGSSSHLRVMVSLLRELLTATVCHVPNHTLCGWTGRMNMGGMSVSRNTLIHVRKRFYKIHSAATVSLWGSRKNDCLNSSLVMMRCQRKLFTRLPCDDYRPASWGTD